MSQQIQWTGSNLEAVQDFLWTHPHYQREDYPNNLYVTTVEGDFYVAPGSFLVIDADGRLLAPVDQTAPAQPPTTPPPAATQPVETIQQAEVVFGVPPADIQSPSPVVS